MIRILYTFLLYCLLPVILLRLWWRSRHVPTYGQRIKERFGFIPIPTHPIDIWLHAVSVGEVIAALPLIKQLQQQDPTLTIAMTCMTPTGSQQIIERLGSSVVHHYLPYDYPMAIKRLLRRWSPKLLIIMETEMWPNLFHYTAKNQIPILLANARLSPKSYRGYRWIRYLTRPMLEKLSLLAAQAQADADYYRQLGAPSQKIVVAGNIKFDLTIPTDLTIRAKQLRCVWGETRSVWIAASTHTGEEEKILTAFTQLKSYIPDLLLILVPRHPERFHEVTQLCQTHPWQVANRSQMKTLTPTTDIMVGDTMGELMLLYAASDVAFVGGSLIAHGGHNLLEPAALKLPVITGPHTFNFTAIHQLLTQANALSVVTTPEQLIENVRQLITDENQRQTLGTRAWQVVRANQGALAQHIQFIQHLLHSPTADFIRHVPHRSRIIN
ncbi:MAG: 3-deoxy-D-manno-octulosonic acid transferase [Legionellales bacterium]|nr:3-deoxy-D-manno-octulosonic acid transferase [Legionellales bacterium]